MRGCDFCNIHHGEGGKFFKESVWKLKKIVMFFFPPLSPHEQKEAEKVKSDGKENGDDKMEVENGEKEVASEAKA